MAKTHHYNDTKDGVEQGYTLDFEDKERSMLSRCLESIGDLLDEEARSNGTTLSIQQHHEMDEIIKDARVQGLLT